MTLDAAILKAMLSHEAGPEMARRIPDWVQRGIVWGRTRYRDPEPVIDTVVLKDIGRDDEIAVVVTGGVMAEREQGSWRWQGLKSGMVWTRRGRARIADIDAHGRLQLMLTDDGAVVVTAVVDTVTGRPRLRFLNRVGFTLGLGGREVYTERIPLPALGFGFALTEVSIVGVEQGDIVLDLGIGRAATAAEPSPPPRTSPAPDAPEQADSSAQRSPRDARD